MSKKVRGLLIALCSGLILVGLTLIGFRLYFIYKDNKGVEESKEIKNRVLRELGYPDESDDGEEGSSETEDLTGVEEEVLESEIVESGVTDEEEKDSVVGNDDGKVYSDYSDEAVALCNALIEELREEYSNEDVVGYLVLDGSEVEYPVMWGDTNDEYIKSDPYGNYDYNGSIFLDSGNHGDFKDSRNLIYGHNMRNGSMFGNLRNLYEEDVIGKTFTLYTSRGILVYDILSCGLINAYSDNYYINPGRDLEKEYLERGYSEEEAYELSLGDVGIVKFYDSIKSQCLSWNGSLVYGESSKITTLMTCYGDGCTYRLAVVGVLRDEENLS